jgi:putative acetyltransferase
MSEIAVREAVAGDAEGVLAMLRSLLDEPHLNISRETFGFTLEDERVFLERMARSERDAYFIALFNDRVVGNIGMHGAAAPSQSHVARLGISVAEGFRGQGVGSALLRRGIDWAREKALLRVELSVHAENHAARRLYERFGFVVEGQHRGEFRKDGRFVDALSMALWLPDVSVDRAEAQEAREVPEAPASTCRRGRSGGCS